MSKTTNHEVVTKTSRVVDSWTRNAQGEPIRAVREVANNAQLQENGGRVFHKGARIA